MLNWLQILERTYMTYPRLGCQLRFRTIVAYIAYMFSREMLGGKLADSFGLPNGTFEDRPSNTYIQLKGFCISYCSLLTGDKVVTSMLKDN